MDTEEGQVLLMTIQAFVQRTLPDIENLPHCVYMILILQAFSFTVALMIHSRVTKQKDIIKQITRAVPSKPQITACSIQRCSELSIVNAPPRVEPKKIPIKVSKSAQVGCDTDNRYIQCVPDVVNRYIQTETVICPSSQSNQEKEPQRIEQSVKKELLSQESSDSSLISPDSQVPQGTGPCKGSYTQRDSESRIYSQYQRDQRKQLVTAQYQYANTGIINSDFTALLANAIRARDQAIDNQPQRDYEPRFRSISDDLTHRPLDSIFGPSLEISQIIEDSVIVDKPAMQEQPEPSNKKSWTDMLMRR